MPDSLRFLTAGESHGPALSAILEGVPAGVPVNRRIIERDMARRQRGYGRGGRMSIEKDRVVITAGVRHGLTLGSPITLTIENRDWDNWREEMSSEAPAEGWVSERVVRTPRPGHADVAGAAKYGHRDMRNVLERASARETAARVAVGALCRCLLDTVGITVAGMVRCIGGAEWDPPAEWSEALVEAAEQSDVGCPDEAAAAAMRRAIDRAREDGDTVGGVFEVRAGGVPPGLGSHVQWDRRLDTRLAAALMSIPAVKGVEIGLGFAAAARPGSQVHDPLVPATGDWPVGRPSNNAGGVEGGISNGEPIVVRAAMKPIPTLTRPLPSVDLDTMQSRQAHAERSDVCAVPAACVVGEAVVCFELARALLAKFGGDCLADTTEAVGAYRRRVGGLWGAQGGA